MNEIKRVLIAIPVMFLLYILAFRIDVIHGTCIDSERNGQTADGYYISYTNTSAQAGDEVLTIDLLSPFDFEPDSILARYDFISKNK